AYRYHRSDVREKLARDRPVLKVEVLRLDAEELVHEEVSLRRTEQQDVDDPLAEKAGGNRDQEKSSQPFENRPAELLEVLEKRHLRQVFTGNRYFVRSPIALYSRRYVHQLR